MVFEKDLTRYGFEDYWTTDDRTFLDPITNQYQFAVIDVSTHEFGHWAGLDHVLMSPSLTMATVKRSLERGKDLPLGDAVAGVSHNAQSAVNWYMAALLLFAATVIFVLGVALLAQGGS